MKVVHLLTWQLRRVEQQIRIERAKLRRLLKSRTELRRGRA